MENRGNLKKSIKPGLIIGAVLILMLTIWYQNLVVRSDFSLSNGDKQEISQYLNEEVMDPNLNGQVYSVYEVLQSNQDIGEVYIWAYIQEYYESDALLESGTGMSLPMVLHVERVGDSLEVKSHVLPRDGSYYSEDIKTLFPRRIQNKIHDYPSKNMENLVVEIENKVNANNE